MAADGAENKNENADKNGTVNESDCKPTELESKIITQIEYYFGDINLPRDKFMLEKIKLDDGWIPMSVMLAFQRLAKLTTDPTVVAKALFHSDLMEVDESGSEIKIRRSPEHPLPEFDEARKKELLDRSIYCGWFPEDTTIDTLLNFFNQYGPVENVVMRKYKDNITKTRKFKGSVFVTFKTKEKGQEFLDLTGVKYQETELTKMWQSEYLTQKKQEFLEKKLKRSKKGEEEQAKEEDPEGDAQMKDKLPRGAIIHLTGDFTGITREIIKEKFSALGFEPAFIEFKIGETEAHVRFSEENAGKNFIEKVGTELEMPNSKLTARLLEGDEENTFLETAAVVRNAALKRRQQLKKGGRKSKKDKSNNRGKKRKGSNISDKSPAAKVVITG
ncbi:UNVERIFIED_CONTAM: hypothetical protein PYX00_006359 [Menopon gallinae]|uniref:La protein n=1 Tax=Menopon gallinae TaxID=328185 RepID=A0AAW2HWL4_9NEOP